MIATEDMLITLGDENDPVVRFWKINSRDFNQVFDQSDKYVESKTIADATATDISYCGGLLAVAFGV